MRGGESMARIIMCGSFKGGVGKTASSWNLAYSLAEMGKRVLAVGFDSQANLTTCFGIEDPAAVPVTIGWKMRKCRIHQNLFRAEMAWTLFRHP